MGTITRRERMLRAIRFEETDIVPYNIQMKPEIRQQLVEYFGQTDLEQWMGNHNIYSTGPEWIQKDLGENRVVPWFGSVLKEPDNPSIGISRVVEPALPQPTLRGFSFPDPGKVKLEPYPFNTERTNMVTITTPGILVGPERIGGKLTPRERFRRTMHFQAVDRIPHREFGYWASLKDRWQVEGRLPQDLPRDADNEIDNDAVEAFFGCDRMTRAGAPVEAGPLRPIEIVEEKDGKVIHRDGLGILCEEVKEGVRSIPHFLEFPIKDRPTWEAFRDEFLVIDDDWRSQSEQEIEALAGKLRTSEHPVGIDFGSFIGWIRDWVGFENLSYLTYDDPQLVEEMVAHLTELKLAHLPPYLDKIEYDYASGWEDIAFNSGPLVSLKTFRNMILPHMKPVMQLLRQHGIDVIFTDCDGNIGALLPLWLEVGLNCMFPVEIRAGNDPVQLRQEYGRDLLMLGGFDKFALLESKEAILAELRRLEPVMRDGGFIPHVDHRCPDGVQFELYQYYIKEKCHFLGMPEDEIRQIPGLAGM